MSNSRGKPTSVADNARREAKMLAKQTKLVLDPFGKEVVELKQPYPKELGEYAVLVIVTPMTSLQFTIAHPVGVTDLDPASWVAHRSDQLQGMLARAKDPNQATLDQSRTAFRQQLAVQAKLLSEKEDAGKKRFFYPHRNDMDRNQLLEDARAKSKEATSQIKARIAALRDDEKREKQGLLEQLHTAEDPLTHLDEATSKAEVGLRKFYQNPQVVQQVLNKHPQAYRTLSGPYFTIPQVEIPESKHLRLEDVAIRFARDLANGGKVSSKPKGNGAKPGVAESALLTPAPPSQPPPAKPTGSDPSPAKPESVLEEEEEVIDPVTGKRSLLDRLTGKASKKG